MRPFAVSLIGRHVFKLGGELYFVAIRVFDHEKQIVARTGASGPDAALCLRVNADPCHA